MEISTISIQAGEKKILGIVAAEGVVDVLAAKEAFAAVRNLFGGRSKTYQKEFANLRSQLIAEIGEQARKLGANGIEGVRFSYFAIPMAERNALLGISLTGTAVMIERAGSPAVRQPGQEGMSASEESRSDKLEPVAFCK